MSRKVLFYGIFVIVVIQGFGNPVTKPQCQNGDCEAEPVCPNSTCRCIYPSKADCAIYYQCAEGKPHQHRCSPGLLFNEDTFTCDYDFNVNCELSTKDDTSIGSFPTSTGNTMPATQSSTYEETTINYTKTNTQLPDTSGETTGETTTSVTTGEHSTDNDVTSPSTSRDTMPTREHSTDNDVTTPSTSSDTMPIGEHSTDIDVTTPSTSSDTMPTREHSTDNDVTTPSTARDTMTTREHSTDKDITTPSTSSDAMPIETTYSKSPITITERFTPSSIVMSTSTVPDTSSTVQKVSTDSLTTQLTTRKETVVITTNNYTEISSESTSQASSTQKIPPELTTAILFQNWTCPSSFGLFPDTDDCNMFYQCSQWKPYHKKCPSGLHFNPAITVCDWPDRAGCGESLTTPAPTEFPISSTPEPEDDMHCDCDLCELPIPDDCTSYILCIDRRVIKITCDSGLYFNAMTGTCDMQNNVQCESNVQCPESSGRFPYPHSCTHFMDCSNFVMTIKQCFEGMIYDRIARICSRNASCEEMSTTTASPAEISPTTTGVTTLKTLSSTSEDTTLNNKETTLNDMETTSLIPDTSERVTIRTTTTVTETHSTDSDVTTQSTERETSPIETTYPKSPETPTETSTNSSTATSTTVPITEKETVSTLTISDISTQPEITSAVPETSKTPGLISTDTVTTPVTTSQFPDISEIVTIRDTTTVTKTHSTDSDVTTPPTERETSPIETTYSKSPETPTETNTNSSIVFTSSAIPITEKEIVSIITANDISTELDTTSAVPETSSTPGLLSTDMLTTPVTISQFPDISEIVTIRATTTVIEAHSTDSNVTTPSSERDTSPIDTTYSKSPETPTETNTNSSIVFTSSAIPITEKEIVSTITANDISTEIDTTSAIPKISSTPETLSTDTTTTPVNTREEIGTTTSDITTNAFVEVSSESTNDDSFTEKIPPDVTTGNLSQNWTCPSRFGLFPDADDCNKFYQCSHWEPYHKKCPSGLHFNTAITVCDWPYRAGCDTSTSSVSTESTQYTEQTSANTSNSGHYFPENSTLRTTPVSDSSTTKLTSSSTTSTLKTESVATAEITVTENENTEVSVISGGTTMTNQYTVTEISMATGENSSNFIPTSTEKGTTDPSYPQKNTTQGDEKRSTQFSNITMGSTISSMHTDKTAEMSSEIITGSIHSSTQATSLPTTLKNSSEISTGSGHLSTDDDTMPSSTTTTTSDEITSNISNFSKGTSSPPDEDVVTTESFSTISSIETVSDIKPFSNNTSTATSYPKSSTVTISPEIESTTADEFSETSTLHLSTTKGTTAGENVDFNCPIRFGLFPDPESCFKFYHCSHFKAYHKTCPSNLHFNSMLQVCDWPYKAGCDSKMKADQRNR